MNRTVDSNVSIDFIELIIILCLVSLFRRCDMDYEHKLRLKEYKINHLRTELETQNPPTLTGK